MTWVYKDIERFNFIQLPGDQVTLGVFKLNQHGKCVATAPSMVHYLHIAYHAHI